jgi:hypothetical protein
MLSETRKNNNTIEKGNVLIKNLGISFISITKVLTIIAEIKINKIIPKTFKKFNKIKEYKPVYL